jgi:hypothetical protein
MNYKECVAAFVGAVFSTFTLVVLSALAFTPEHFGYLFYLVPATLLFGVGYLMARARLGLTARLKTTFSPVVVMIPWLIVCATFFFGEFQVSGSLNVLGQAVVYSSVALINWWLFRSELEKQKASI